MQSRQLQPGVGTSGPNIASRAARPHGLVSRAPSVVGRTQPAELYEVALIYAREEQYRAGKVLFERLLRAQPSMCKAWVSYAMMVKRAGDRERRFDRCRSVLQRGLRANPSSACLIQAWGLMELQRGNWLAALLLLQRAVKLEPHLQPVLNWAQVQVARNTLKSTPATTVSKDSSSSNGGTR